MNLSLCLEMVFTDRPFVERLAKAARLGYRAVEFWDWRDKDIDAVGREADRLGLTIAAISGNRKHALADPRARAGLMDEMEQVFAVARRLRCRHVMMLSDVLEPDGSVAAAPGFEETDRLGSIAQGLGALADRISEEDMTLLLEPLNTVVDHRGCFLDSSGAAAGVVQSVGHARVRMLYDIYHMSMMGEDAPVEIEKKARWIGYLHAADMPGRHEPGSGSIPWAAIRSVIEKQRYRGFIGMEFSPLANHEAAVRRSLETFRTAPSVSAGTDFA